MIEWLLLLLFCVRNRLAIRLALLVKQDALLVGGGGGGGLAVHLNFNLIGV